MERLSSCPICSSKDFTLAHKPDLCRCSQCRVHFRNPRPKQARVMACYDRGVTFQQWQHELEIRSYLWQKRLALIKSYRQAGTLLDIGTGDGYFLNFAKDNFNVEATEISKIGIRYARSWGHRVHHGTIFDAEFNDKQYDIITLWHVLEHLSEPAQALSRVMELLSVNGLLFIAVPNEITPLHTLAALRKKQHPFGELGCNDEIHLIHFTPYVLLNILKNQYNLEVLELGVDDVHVDNRNKKMRGMFINKLLSKAFKFHFDKAMVFVCSKKS